MASVDYLEKIAEQIVEMGAAQLEMKIDPKKKKDLVNRAKWAMIHWVFSRLSVGQLEAEKILIPKKNG